MLHLLDASALITAHNTYLALHRVPEFWAWLRHHGERGSVKIPRAIYEEIEDGNDALAAWTKDRSNKEALLLDEPPHTSHLRFAMGCYGGSLSEADLITIGRDPFLIAAAMVHPAERCIVTAEVSKPARTGARRHIPNVCSDCGVHWMNPVQFVNALDFSTAWDVV